MDMVEGGKIIGLGTKARSTHWGTTPSCRFWESVRHQLMRNMDGHIYCGSKSAFKLTSSFFLCQANYLFGIDVEGKWQKTLKCLALSSTHGYFTHFLKGTLMPWHARELTAPILILTEG